MIKALMIIITSIGSTPQAQALLVSPMECAAAAEDMAAAVAAGKAEGVVLCLYEEDMAYE
ncbi:hypothetical protein [Zavarzinia aquatilis]|uniref:Uncharacterized protein n=1 Tax=Zavarzinia aquatilis TaxID=2211142 RepID=A0A317DSK7_9PROT|nr:hypothetical protein [Zavarzinia aquatilis]PWR17657.1 hypothetical protein DKG74_20840 [Zavarzinia aquatilis]